MPRRTLLHQIIPWTGGVNTSVDDGVTPEQDLRQADNVVFSNSGARIKRQGFSYLDSAPPAVTSRESSGTTRTLHFEAAGDGVIEGADNRLVVGERITVADTADSNYDVTDGTILTVTATTITYTGSGSHTESKTATSTCTVTRSRPYISLLDYWYVNVSLEKTQLLMAASNQGKLFKFDANLNRIEVTGQPETTTVQCIAASGMSSGEYFKLWSANDAAEYWVWFDINSGGGAPSPPGSEILAEVDITSTDTADQVASALQAVINALTPFSASVSTDTVTITNATAGATTDTVDVSTGFTITTTNQGATLPTGTPDRIHTNVMNNYYIQSFPARGDKPIKFDAANDSVYKLLAGSPPDLSIGTVFLGRLWTNDKDEPDRLHYSATGDSEKWLGTADSGALDIDPGDGDDAGISSVFVYQNILYVGKGSKLYRVRGETPETFLIEPATRGIGCESHAATITVDNRDTVFLSRRGFHSIIATDRYGDTENAFLSAKIQPTFDGWSRGRLRYTQGTYIPTLNSIAFAISEGGSTQDNIWLYNVEAGQWYRWPSTPCAALSRRFVSNDYKMIFSNYAGRISQAQNGVYTDYGSNAITYTIQTGTIYPQNDAVSRKGFKSLSLLYRPKGRYRFAVSVTVDNHNAQLLIFEDSNPGNALGTAFILGESRLAVSGKLQPFTRALAGHGVGCDINIINNELSDQVEIYGLILEFEPHDIRQEPSSDDLGEA